MTSAPPNPVITTPPPHPSVKTIEIIGRLTAILVVIIAMAAFGLSFDALRDLAVVSGVMKNGEAWLFPVIVDGGIVVFSLAALRASLAGTDRRWFMSLVITVTLISIGLNIAHTRSGLLAAVMAAMPPLLLFLAFESLMRQIHETVLKPTMQKPRKHKAGKPAPLIALVCGGGDIADRKVRAAVMLSQGYSRNRIARELNVTANTVRRYLNNSKCA